MEYQCFLFTITTRILLILPGMVTAMTDKQRIQDDLWLYREKVTWEQAFNFCQADAASLAVPGPQEDSAIRSAINNGHDHVWVGQYSYTTPWMYPTGCFVSDKASARMIENNDIFTCKRLCGESDIMLNIYNCLCVNEASDVSDRQKSSMCNTTCPGNTDEFCGGENVYQHYSTYTAIEDGQQDIYDCGMLEIHSSNQSFTVLPRHCNMVNPYLCEIYDNTTSGVTHYMPTKNDGSPEYLPHQTALQRCARNGSYLADPTKLNLTQFISGVPTQYWVGVRRRIHHVTSVNDQDLPKTQRNPKCLYMIKGSRGVSKDRTKDCSETALFLCRKQKKGSNFTTLPEEMTAVQAYMECKRLNSTLEVPGLDDIEAWNTLLNNTEGKGIWTGETLELAPWAFAIDCYRIDDSPVRIKDNNSGSTCLQDCANKTDVFVKESTCLCLDRGNHEVPSDVPVARCNRSCLTDGGTCGSPAVYTRYSQCKKPKASLFPVK